MADTVRNSRRLMIGTVTSTKMHKTITVEVERTYKHPKYGKYVRERKRLHAHDEKQEAGLGDIVELMSARPTSKLKRWRLTRIVEAAPDRGADVTVALGDVDHQGRDLQAPEEGGDA
jgi:small subunit ribosomal protein S17